MHPLLLLTTSSAIVGESSPRLRTAAVSPVLRTAVPVLRRTARAPAPVALADDGGGGLLATLESFQSSHALLISILVAIGTRYIISEVRYRFEKPVMDELGNRVATELKPDTDRIDGLGRSSRAASLSTWPATPRNLFLSSASSPTSRLRPQRRVSSGPSSRALS